MDAVLRRLARAGRFRDEETAEHVERMSRSCALIARGLGRDQAECIGLRAASALHDIGKVGVPDAILRKPGRLTERERALVERHSEIGHEILAGPGDHVFALAAKVALTHHERVDGTGYPTGLHGVEIPLEGRIAAVADVFDALTHDRVYRAAFDMDEALEIMEKDCGTQFDERVFSAFREVLPEILETSKRYVDSWQPEPPASQDPADEVGALSVLVVEDHEAIAKGLSLLLRREGIDVAGTAHSLEEGRGLLARSRPDVVIVDSDLAGARGLDLIPAAQRAGTRVLVYTERTSAVVEEARKAGADGVASKRSSPASLVASVRKVCRGEWVVDPRLREGVVAARQVTGLTPREREVVAFLAGGLTGEQIAVRLFLSPETVRTHIRNAMGRLGAKTRAHLVTLAAERKEISSAEALGAVGAEQLG